MPRSMEVVPYNPAWPDEFQAERDCVAGVLRENALAIHHVGRTAIPGLKARPIIDLLVEAGSLEVEFRFDPPGYTNGKSAFIQELNRKARAFYEKS